MRLGLALVRAASTGGGSALYGPAFVFAFGASIQGLKRIAWTGSNGSQARSSDLCLLMQAFSMAPTCWIQTNDRLLRRHELAQSELGFLRLSLVFWMRRAP